MLPLFPSRADIADFDYRPSAMLAGDALATVDALADSIVAHGLLSPLVVTQSANGRLTVVDGKARLTAIRRLRFLGRLPRSLATIPYILAEEVAAQPERRLPSRNALSLLHPIEQVEQVEALTADGLTDAQIADTLYASEDLVAAIRSVSCLSDRLRNALFGGHIDLEQASAFATLPNPDSQDALLLALGPFVGAPAILAAIAAGATVVSIGTREDDILILPSRAAA